MLDGDDLPAREGLIFGLLTVTENGWPHLAMLSVGELVAVGPRDLRAALWPNSTATANLTRTGRATITLVHARVGYSIRCTAERGADLNAGHSSPLAFFELRVEDVLEDVAPYAVLTSGATYRLDDPDRVFPRWRATVEAMRARTTDAL